jgi:hypothetical protein
LTAVLGHHSHNILAGNVGWAPPNVNDGATPISSWYISCGITSTQNKGGGDIFCGNRSSAGAKHIYWSAQPKRKRKK